IANDNIVKIWNIGQTDSSKPSCVCVGTTICPTNHYYYVVALPYKHKYIPKKQRINGSRYKNFAIWYQQTRNYEITLEGHSTYVTYCSVLSDGRIITGSNKGTYKLWNAQTGI